MRSSLTGFIVSSAAMCRRGKRKSKTRKANWNRLH